MLARVDQYVGMGIRLSKAEMRRLEDLARATGRSKGSVVRALIRLASARDANALELVRESISTLNWEAADGKA